MKQTYVFISLILVAHMSLGIAFSLATPIFEPPDEANHYLFVRYLQLVHQLPVQGLDPDGPRAHHPPLYYVLGAFLTAWVPGQGGADRVVMTLNPHTWFRYGDPQIENKALWVHYTPDERWPYRGPALAVHLLRLLSVGFSTLAVWLTYLAAQHMRPGDEPFALLAAGLLGFNSMVLFMSGVVQNSTAAITSTAAVLYVLARFTRQGFTFARWMWVGVAFALGVLLQTSALTLVVPVGVVLVYDAWRSRKFSALLLGAAGFLLPIAMIDGWWFVRNQVLYGDWTANSTIAALWTYGPIMPLDVALYLVGTGIVGRFGQGLMVEFPAPLYLGVGVLALISLAGLIGSASVNMRQALAQPNGTWLKKLGALLTPDVMLWSVQVITVVAVSAALVVYLYKYIHGVHGRYLFTAFPAMALLFAAGALVWVRPRSQGRLTLAVLTLFAALAVYGLFGLLIPTYAIPRTLTSDEQKQLTPLDADIGDTARVLGYSVNTSAVRPGGELILNVAWLPLSQTDIPCTVFVHLYDPELGSLTQLDIYPGQGNYATTVWDVGRPFVDTYRLSLPPDTPPTSQAKILLGLYDEATMQRLPVTGADAGPAEESWVQFGSLQIKP